MENLNILQIQKLVDENKLSYAYAYECAFNKRKNPF